jgi:glutaredoxin
MKQQCHLSFIYFSWLVYLGGLAYLAGHSRWAHAALWLVAVPLVQWLYIRKFRAVAPMMGYGAIVDEPAEAFGRNTPAKVTLYTALGCPFCPVMEQRLEDLRKQFDFQVEKVDVTLRPDLLASKGIRSVPVIEAGGQFYCGLVTSKSLAAMIAGMSVPPMAQIEK